MRWIFLPFKFARREMRAGLKGFYIFIACLTLGVGSIAAVLSLSRGLIDSLHYDAKYILGGDIALRKAYEPATKEQYNFLQHIGPTTIVMETSAMARTADEKKSVLVELKAVDPYYPLYGSLEFTAENGEVLGASTQDLLLPPPMGPDEKEIDDWGAVVEKDLLPRLQIHVGDYIRVGEKRFQIRGLIKKEPDRVGSARFSLAPRVMISRFAYDNLGLNRKGSQVYFDHRIILMNAKPEKILAAQKMIAEKYPDAGWKGRNFYNASPQVEKMIAQVTLFLSLIGLSTLLIGGVGMASAVKSFLDGKLANIATLKCLGAPQSFAFRAYMAQIMVLALLGVLLGILLGIAASQGAGALLTAKLSLTDKVGIYPPELLIAGLFGLLTALAFSLWPLGRAIRVAPNDLFRDLVAPASKKPSLNVMLGVLIAGQLLALSAIATSPDPLFAAGFALSALAAFSVFHLYSAAIRSLMRLLKIPASPELRMAIANLWRPGNASSNVILSLGLGLTVLVALSLVQYNFIRALAGDAASDAPSFFFADIAPTQRNDFLQLAGGYPSARNLQLAPSYRGSILRIGEKPAAEALASPADTWVITSDRGFTVAAKPPAYSKVTAGKWWDENYAGEPLVAVAEEVARAFSVGVGDSMTFDVMGIEITAKVSGLYAAQWSSFTLSFPVTFSPGALGFPPATYIGNVTVDAAKEESLQTAVAKNFPDVTAIRTREAVRAAETMVRGTGQAVRISAAATLAAGMLVLAGGIAAARRRHIYDAVVLKVLGATKGRILKTFLFEYGILGLLTVIVSSALGTLAAYGVQRKIMDTGWEFSLTALLSVTLPCLAVTLLAGAAGTWRALQQRPQLYLRNQ